MFDSPVNCVFEPSKEEKHAKLSVLEEKQGQFWNLH